jgi:hypothetical protein
MPWQAEPQERKLSTSSTKEEQGCEMTSYNNDTMGM